MPRTPMRFALQIALLTVLLVGREFVRADAPAATAPASDEAVKVEKAEVVVEYKRFDPYHMPTPPPPIEKGEAAVTVYRFGVEVDSKYSYTQSAKAPPGPAKLDVTVEEISVRLTLSVTVWLPDNASKELAAHEEGHRWIAEKFYADAEQVVRPMAQRWVGKKLKGEGRDAKAAARFVTDNDSQKTGEVYGAYGYTPDKDVVRAPMKMTTLPFSVDQLTWDFTDMSDTAGSMTIMWDKTAASVPFRVGGS